MVNFGVFITMENMMHEKTETIDFQNPLVVTGLYFMDEFSKLSPVFESILDF